MHCINMVSEGCRLSCSVPLGFKRNLLFFVFVTDLKVGENRAHEIVIPLTILKAGLRSFNRIK